MIGYTEANVRLMIDAIKRAPIPHGWRGDGMVRSQAETALAALAAAGRLRGEGERTCDALCRDVERDRDALRAELDRLRGEREVDHA